MSNRRWCALQLVLSRKKYVQPGIHANRARSQTHSVKISGKSSNTSNPSNSTHKNQTTRLNQEVRHHQIRQKSNKPINSIKLGNSNIKSEELQKSRYNRNKQMHRFDYFILSTSLIFLSTTRIVRARQKTELGKFKIEISRNPSSVWLCVFEVCAACF